jgi:two-component system, NtrC family, sensor kinase
VDDSFRDLAYLAAAVSHHVINAFSAVVSNAELIRAATIERPDSSELDELAEAIVRASLGASQIARRLIDWTRRITPVELGATGPGVEVVDLNRLIGEVVETQRSKRDYRADWELRLGPVPSIPGDAASLRIMLTYVIDNALEALPGGAGRVGVSTAVDVRNWLVIEIRDSGSGMGQELLNRATEPFFSTKPDHPGIGLTIAQGIWRRHRGALAIEARPGQGTTVRLSYGPLPGPAETQPAAPLRQEAAPAQGAHTVPPGTEAVPGS